MTSPRSEKDSQQSSAGDDRRAGSPLEVSASSSSSASARLAVRSRISAISAKSSSFRRRWLSEQTFVDLVALCQFLPGPASSQTGFAIGLIRAGYAGALAAWAGFTLPSAILLVLFAYGAGALSGTIGIGLLHGLKLVAVAIVAQSVWGMARSLTPDRERASIAMRDHGTGSRWSKGSQGGRGWGLRRVRCRFLVEIGPPERQAVSERAEDQTAARLVSEDLVIPVGGMLVGRDQKTQKTRLISNSNGSHLNPLTCKVC